MLGGKYMKAKILYTNGDNTVELFWIKHTGSDVYCGSSGSDTKKSYHESGKLHWKKEGKEIGGAWVAPLKEVKGQFHLMTIGLNNSCDFPDKTCHKIGFKQHEVDAALYIDSRSIPEKEFINITVGLLEPSCFNSLHEIVVASENVKQVLLATETVPWIYCILVYPPPIRMT
jgi:hypothetical protein